MSRVSARRGTGGLFLYASCGILIRSLFWAHPATAQENFNIADAIPRSCLEVPTYDGDPASWRSRRFPDAISVDIVQSRQRTWTERLLRELTSRTHNISASARRKYEATVSWEIDGQPCTAEAEVRINGDAKDHISYQGSTVIASVAVKLLEGHVGNAVRFKLLLPETRVGENEIISILLFREFGFLAPETRLVTGYLNGIRTPYMFQESPAKEFMESNDLRESVLVEGDERWGWLMHSSPDVYAETLNHDAVWVENRSFGRVDNGGWLDNPTSTAIGVTGLTVADRLYHQYHIDKPFRTGLEEHLGMTSSYRLRQNSEVIEGESLFVLLSKLTYASHGLRLHNRKFYYDPAYQVLKPIYYDGMALRGRDNYANQFPRNGTFPQHELDLAIEKLSDPELRERVYAGLVERGGVTPRDEFERTMDIVLNRAIAMVPSPPEPVAEPDPVVQLDLELLLAEEEVEDHYEFYGFDTQAGAFQHCIMVPDAAAGHTVTCGDTSLEPKDILSEPVADNDDPIPFVGAYRRTEDGEFRFEVPNHIRDIVTRNPTEIEIVVGPDEMHILEFSHEYAGESPPVIHATMESTDSRSGKLLVKGAIPAGAEFLITGNGGTVGLTRYDERLLTGCITFMDATVENLKVTANNVACEDSVNFVRVSGSIEALNIDSSLADAIDADFSEIHFRQITIRNAANDCIDLSAGHYRVDELVAQGCGDKGLSVGEKAIVEVDRLIVSDAIFGAVAKDNSYVSLMDAEFQQLDICLAAYRKKQEFDGAYIQYSHSVAEHCPAERQQIQDGSIARLGF